MNNEKFDELLLQIHLQDNKWMRIRIGSNADSQLILRVDTNHPQDRRHFGSGLKSGKGCHPHYDGITHNEKLGWGSWVEEYISTICCGERMVREVLWLRYALPQNGRKSATYTKGGALIIRCGITVDDKQKLIDLANVLARSMHGSDPKTDRKVRLVGLKNSRVRFVREAKVADLPTVPTQSSLYEKVKMTPYPRPDKAGNIWAL